MSAIREVLSYLILGLVQGITEFLPVSSSGHLTLGASILELPEEDLTFAVLVHGATALSTIVVFRKDIASLILGFFKKGVEGGSSRRYIGLIALSAVPAAIIGLTMKDFIEELASTQFVGAMLIVTAGILAISQKSKASKKELTPVKASLVGIAQAFAILPGISRSGSTIGAALLLGISRAEAAKFSFLMALPPIIGANLLEMKDLMESETVVNNSHIPFFGYSIGVVAAFVAGWAACKWMIKLVKGTNLMWFAVYCLVVGLIALLF
ncbi:MAG: UDP-diphosphatase [Bacteroidetes bacterium]|nr:MAG: UDP-diphosphatase [Bacteroidota bacterium]